MGADELLRRYLEQRRELGESELVLDSLTVEEVMRMIGAGQHRASEPARPPGEPAEPRPRDVREATAPPEPQGQSSSTADHPTDWREALRSIGADRPARSASNRPAPTAADPPSPPVVKAGEGEAAARPVAADGSGNPQRQGSAPAPVERGTSGRTAPEGRGPSDTADASRPPAAPLGMAGAPPGLVVGSGVAELFGGPISEAAALEMIGELVNACQRCDLYKTATHGVPGEGNPDADVMCIGEAPGANEDATGRPFVGAAGQLLTKILAAIDLKREDVFIANVLKHRPPGNRNPLPEEVDACRPYLVRQVELVRPKVIIAFGTFAAQTLLDTKLTIGKLRGSVHRYHGVPVIVTYHPAALLRNPAWKRPAWEDVQLARRILDHDAA